MTGKNRRLLIWLLVAAAAVFGLLRCAAGPDGATTEEAVRVFGPWVGEEAVAFDAVLTDFTDRTGIAVEYLGSSDFDSDLQVQVSGGLRLPDIAVMPQPALFAELVVLGALEPLADETVETIVDNFDLTREELIFADGEAYLAPYRNNLKSLVWYRPQLFEENGWVVPTTLSELRTFAAELAAGDIAPWCFSVEAGSVSGWPATDWVEDLVLRDAGVDAYDEWVRGDRKFADPAIRDAIADFEDLVLSPGHVAGGTQRVVTTPVETAADPLFGDEPGCAMYKQASFARNWFPEGTTIGADGDIDYFVLPGRDGVEAPLLVGSDSLVAFSDRPEVTELLTFLVSADGAAAWIERGDFLSARTTVDLATLEPVDRRFTEILTDAAELRTDASDSFPSTLRALFLDELTEFIAETNYLDDDATLDDLVDTMDAARTPADEEP